MLVMAIILAFYTQFSTASERNALKELQENVELLKRNSNNLVLEKISNDLDEIIRATEEKIKVFTTFPCENGQTSFNWYSTMDLLLKRALKYDPKDVIDIMHKLEKDKQDSAVTEKTNTLSKILTELRKVKPLPH